MKGMRSRWIPLLAWTVAATMLAAGPVPVFGQETVSVDADAPMLGLGDCVDLALGSSPTLRVSQEQRHIAGQDVTAAWMSFTPDLNLSRTWAKSERTEFDVDVGGGNTMDITNNSKRKDWSGRVGLNVFSGFRKFAVLGSAKAGVRAAEATEGYTRELVVQDVVMAYYNLLRSAELLEVAIETRDQAAAELERTETYFRLGSAAKSDVLQQRVRLENTRLDVVRADNAVKQDFADLAYAMNRPLVSAFRVDRSILDTDFFVGPVDSLYNEALTNRMDLKSRAETVEARRKDVTAATSNAWPSLDLFANYARYDDDTPYTVGISQQSETTNFGYQINWNIFDRWQTWSGRSQAKASARIAEYEHDQAKLNVQVEIRQLHNLMIEARELAKVSRETIVQSEEELRLAQERFRVGAGTTLDIIVAQANLANSRGQEVQAKCDFLIARAQMHRAVGRLSPWTRTADNR